MPIEHYENNKTVIIAGKGDIIWSSGSQKKDTKPEYIVFFSDGKKRIVGERIPELANTEIEDWSVKIVLPTKETWKSLVSVLNDYYKEKWG